jgi:hypothetical protein
MHTSDLDIICGVPLVSVGACGPESIHLVLEETAGSDSIYLDALGFTSC